jgi:hypothetical protein
MRNFHSIERRQHESNNRNIFSGINHGHGRRNCYVNLLGHDYDAVKERRLIGAFGTGFLLGTLCGIFFVSMGKSAKRRDSIEN